MDDFLSAEFWNQRYLHNQIGWDLGQISEPIKEYVDQLSSKELSILIPGCGSGHEARYLHEIGFQNVHILDFSPLPLTNFRTSNPSFPESKIHQCDFFKHEGLYDLIIEQTLFCAIDPALRERYAEKMSQLLKKGGKLVGLLFDREFQTGPPFGGSKREYVSYFEKYFNQLEMTPCYNSILPRTGTELFIKLQK